MLIKNYLKKTTILLATENFCNNYSKISIIRLILILYHTFDEISYLFLKEGSSSQSSLCPSLTYDGTFHYMIR